MFTNWNQFITWEKSTLDTIDVKKIYIDMADDVMAGIMLSQIVYWYLPSKKGKSKLKVKQKDKKTGKIHFWIAKPREEWYEEIRFTKDNVITAMKKLEKKKIIFRQDNMFDGKRTAHIRLNLPVFLGLLNDLLTKQTKALDEYEQYIEDEMTTIFEEKDHETLGSHGLSGIQTTDRQESRQPIGGNADNRLSEMQTNITESTTESTTKITSDSMCNEETEILSLLESRSDINKHTHKQLINLLNAVKKKDTFQYSIFVDTLNLIDFDIQDLNYFKRALTNNFKKGYVRTATDKALTGSTRKEVLPDWFDEDEYKTVKPAAQQSELDLGQKKQELEDMLKRLRA